jgi:hypothetical protein
MTATLSKPLVAALVAGRAAYRLALYGAGVGLLALWGPEPFAAYAAATGATGWLFALTSAGPEKAALALVPRTGGTALERLFLALATVPFAVLAGAYLLLRLVGTPISAQRYAAAAAVTAGVGTCAVLAALYRMRERPHADVVAYAALAAGYLLAVCLVWTAGLSVDGVLVTLVVVVGVVVAALAVGLAPGIRRGPRAAGDAVGPALRASATLGTGELVAMAAVSALYLVLAADGDAAQISAFYVLLIVSSSLSVGWAYLLRLAQPRTVRRLEARGAADGWRLARTLSGWTAAAGATAVVALVVALLVHGRASALAFVAVAVEVALFAAASAVMLVAESLAARGRRASAGGSLVAAIVAVGGAVWLVPVAGAAGAFAALAAGEVVRTAVLHGVARPVRDRGVPALGGSVATR